MANRWLLPCLRYVPANANHMASDGIDIPIPIPIPKSYYYSPSVGVLSVPPTLESSSSVPYTRERGR